MPLPKTREQIVAYCEDPTNTPRNYLVYIAEDLGIKISKSNKKYIDRVALAKEIMQTLRRRDADEGSMTSVASSPASVTSLIASSVASPFDRPKLTGKSGRKPCDPKSRRADIVALATSLGIPIKRDPPGKGVKTIKELCRDIDAQNGVESPEPKRPPKKGAAPPHRPKRSSNYKDVLASFFPDGYTDKIGEQGFIIEATMPNNHILFKVGRFDLENDMIKTTAWVNGENIKVRIKDIVDNEKVTYEDDIAVKGTKLEPLRTAMVGAFQAAMDSGSDSGSDSDEKVAPPPRRSKSSSNYMDVINKIFPGNKKEFGGEHLTITATVPNDHILVEDYDFKDLGIKISKMIAWVDGNNIHIKVHYRDSENKSKMFNEDIHVEGAALESLRAAMIQAYREHQAESESDSSDEEEIEAPLRIKGKRPVRFVGEDIEIPRRAATTGYNPFDEIPATTGYNPFDEIPSEAGPSGTRPVFFEDDEKLGVLPLLPPPPLPFVASPELYPTACNEVITDENGRKKLRGCPPDKPYCSGTSGRCHAGRTGGEDRVVETISGVQVIGTEETVRELRRLVEGDVAEDIEGDVAEAVVARAKSIKGKAPDRMPSHPSYAVAEGPAAAEVSGERRKIEHSIEKCLALLESGE